MIDSSKLFSNHQSRSEPKILKIIDQGKKGNILLSVDYLRVINFIAAHLYVANPQSRVGAINRLTLDQCQILCTDGRLECSDFKTWESYEAQFITACPATIMYLESYEKYLRPNNSEETTFFLNSLGKPMTDLGRCVSKFFEENGSLHITTTTIRYEVI